MNYYTSTPTSYARRELFNEYDPTERWETAPSVEDVIKDLQDKIRFEHHYSTEFACNVMTAFFADVDFEELAETIISDYYGE